jgi:GT2 family glycosyltransferase
MTQTSLFPATAKHDISGSIVVYKNDPHQLMRAIRSFLQARLRHRLLVIDNSPGDDLRSLCLDNGAEYLFVGANRGFGAGHNLGMSKLLNESAYHLIMNPDVYFGKGVLERLHEFMQSNLDVGLVMPKVLYPDGSLQYLCKRLPTPWDFLIRRFLPGFAKPFLRARMDWYECRDQNYGELMEVAFLSGCFMFSRCSVLRRVGLFDERFFMYLEDVDLTRRIKRVARTVYFPEVAIFHEFQGSQKSFRLLLHHLRSTIAYFNKWGWYFDQERVAMNKVSARPSPSSDVRTRVITS